MSNTMALRWQDVLAATRKIGLQAVKQPALALTQEAALARRLVGALTAKQEPQAPKGDKRFADPAWQGNPLYRGLMQGRRVVVAGFGNKILVALLRMLPK